MHFVFLVHSFLIQSDEIWRNFYLSVRVTLSILCCLSVCLINLSRFCSFMTDNLIIFPPFVVYLYYIVQSPHLQLLVNSVSLTLNLLNRQRKRTFLCQQSERRERERTSEVIIFCFALQIYGAVTMNNTLCLGVFLAIIYIRGLDWDFSAEVLVIVLVVLVMGLLGSFRTTFPLWMSFIAFLFYPLTLAIVYVLDYVLGWS